MESPTAFRFSLAVLDSLRLIQDGMLLQREVREALRWHALLTRQEVLAALSQCVTKSQAAYEGYERGRRSLEGYRFEAVPDRQRDVEISAIAVLTEAYLSLEVEQYALLDEDPDTFYRGPTGEGYLMWPQIVERATSATEEALCELVGRLLEAENDRADSFRLALRNMAACLDRTIGNSLVFTDAEYGELCRYVEAHFGAPVTARGIAIRNGWPAPYNRVAWVLVAAVVMMAYKVP